MAQRLTLEDPVVLKIAEVANRDGDEVYVVGGYVRDLLLGNPGKDTDLVVVGDGVAFARRAARALNAPPPVVFEKFGTAMVTLEDRKVEFVGARRESYQRDSRKPSVAEGTLQEDLSRRDFTVNAVAVSLKIADGGVLVDPFNGVSDMTRRLLRTPRDPRETFDDDPLRIMRAMRFASQLGFEVHPDILAASGEMRERLAIVSQERIADEVLKILASPRPSVGLGLLFDTGVMAVVFPELAQLAGVDQRQDFHHKDVFRHTLRVVDNMCETTDNVWLRVAALLHDIAKPKTKAFKEGIGWTFHGHEEAGARMVKSIFRKMRFPMDKVPYVEKLVRLHLRPMALVDHEVTDSAVRRLLFDAGEEVDDLMMLCRADITSKNPKLVEKVKQNYDLVARKMVEVEEKDKIRAWRPPLRGEEIMEVCGLEPGPAVGVLKDRITDAILDGEIPNEHGAALAFLLKIKDDVLSTPIKKKPRKSRSHPPGGNPELSGSVQQ